MTNPTYILHYHCHICGEMHLVAAPLCLPADLTEPCTLADLYPGGNMPPAIVDFLTDSLLWCDQANDYIERSDPARIHLTTLPPPWPPEPEQKNGPGAAQNAHPPGHYSSPAGLERNNPAKD